MYPLLIAMFIFIVQAYSSAYGSTVVLTVIWPIYVQGIASGWLYANRVLASVSILLLLVESKSQLELIEALRWFKVPIEIRNLMSLMFRYVSVLSEEFTTMFQARNRREGFSAKLSWVKKLHNMGIIAGMLVIRSYDRSYRVETEAVFTRCGCVSVFPGYAGEACRNPWVEDVCTGRNGRRQGRPGRLRPGPAFSVSDLPGSSSPSTTRRPATDRVRTSGRSTVPQEYDE